MKFDPQLLQAMSLWAQAQYAYSVQQWSTAHSFYTRVLPIYEEQHDFHAAYRTVYQLCLVAKHQNNWADMADYASALLESNPRLSSIEESWLLLGHAERRRNHTVQARQALAECIRLSDVQLTLLLHDREPVPFDRWYPNQARIYAEALHEWGLLEAGLGEIRESVNLIKLGELILLQAIESFTTLPFSTEQQLSELVLLRG